MTLLKYSNGSIGTPSTFASILAPYLLLAPKFCNPNVPIFLTSIMCKFCEFLDMRKTLMEIIFEYSDRDEVSSEIEL